MIFWFANQNLWKNVAYGVQTMKEHFLCEQTLFLEHDLMLCDCPGLVMPSFVFTKAEMVVNGILPIDQMRDHVPPITLVASLIPRHELEYIYGIMLPPPTEGEDPMRPPTAEELLNAYGCMYFLVTYKIWLLFVKLFVCFLCYFMLFFYIYITDACTLEWCSSNTLDLDWGGTQFQSELGYWTSWGFFFFFVWFPSVSSDEWYIHIDHTFLITNLYFLTIHSDLTISFKATWSLCKCTIIWKLQEGEWRH